MLYIQCKNITIELNVLQLNIVKKVKNNVKRNKMLHSNIAKKIHKELKNGINVTNKYLINLLYNIFTYINDTKRCCNCLLQH